MIELLRTYFPQFSHIEEASIKTNDEIIGWHCTVFSNDGLPVGSGCSQQKDTARIIACAETIERGLFRKYYSYPSPKPFLLDQIPSTCGFAVGFQSETTKMRAIAEAVERWAWSTWIDDKLKIAEFSPTKSELGNLGIFFLSKFDSVKFFKKNLSIVVEGQVSHLQFGVTVGLKGSGAFPGSRVCSLIESPWEHGLIEAWRHQIIAKGVTPEQGQKELYKARVLFFSKNAKVALKAIDSSNNLAAWKAPTLRLLEEAKELIPGVFLWRALCENFNGRHSGDEKRFVY